MSDAAHKPTNVLLVVNDPSDVQRLREMLSEAGGPPFTVVNVPAIEQALRALTQTEVDVILLDLSTRGDQAIRHYVEFHAHVPDTPIIVLSDSENEALAVEIVWAGAQDYLVKAKLNIGHLRRAIWFAVSRFLLLRALRESQRLLLQTELDSLSKIHYDESVHLSDLLADLDIAAKFQTFLLPKHVPEIEGYDIATYYQPCKEVGGDYFDFITATPESLGIVVADVAGKSVQGMVGMVMFRSLLRMNARGSGSARVPLIASNKQIADDLSPGMFVTCCYMVLRHTEAELLLCIAGHPPPIYWRSKMGECRTIRDVGMVVGFDRGPLFDPILREHRISLAPGDRILVYSDGITDETNAKGERFGEKRLLDLTSAYANLPSREFVQALVTAADDFRGGTEPFDDVTIVTFRYLG
ncbi:MAG: SpoIIE family protein phosphatase [Planctomycetota bacterium]